MTRKIVATEYVTLDGFMDEPGEWSMPFWSDEAGAYKQEEIFAFEAMLLGRRTYDGFSKAWPEMDGEFADRMNGMPKYVASRTLETAGWNSTILQGDVAQAVKELKEREGGDLLLAGSGELLNLLAEHDLIDEYRLMVHPFILGEGKKRLFTTAPRRELKLTGSVTFASGVAVHTYEPVR